MLCESGEGHYLHLIVYGYKLNHIFFALTVIIALLTQKNNQY